MSIHNNTQQTSTPLPKIPEVAGGVVFYISAAINCTICDARNYFDIVPPMQLLLISSYALQVSCWCHHLSKSNEFSVSHTLYGFISNRAEATALLHLSGVTYISLLLCSLAIRYVSYRKTVLGLAQKA